MNEKLLDFIYRSPSPFHAVENCANELREAGYTELYENSGFDVSYGGKYFVRRNMSSLIAFRLPEKSFDGFMIMAAHSDSPSFKIKEKPGVKAAGIYAQLNTEKYGGMICSSWMDRPLSAAGRVIVKNGDRLETKLVNIDKDLLLIPNVAIHMDRSVNEGKNYNANIDMLPLMGSEKLADGFEAIVANWAGCEKDSIVSTDLFLYPRCKGRVWGAEDEYICSPRLDDLQCVFGCMQGLVNSKGSDSASVFCVFDNEEVGSGTKQGADSSFLEDVLFRCCEALGKNSSEYRRMLANSFMVSADNAHAVHPNHPEYADRNDRPEMNKGIVIKFNANQRYTTDAVSAAVFGDICNRAGVPTQRLSNRADIQGGSTLGNISSSHVAVNSVDIGLPQLAMHSVMETAGAKDTEYLVKAAEKFYDSSLEIHGGIVEIKA